MKIEELVILGITGLATYRMVSWVRDAKPGPDPWGTEIEQALDSPDAVPVCHHCLAPQEHSGWFCPECGAVTGQYANYLPSVYIYSMGEAFRRGVTEPMRWSALIVIGYILASLCYFSVLAPICLAFLFHHRQQSLREARGQQIS